MIYPNTIFMGAASCLAKALKPVYASSINNGKKAWASKEIPSLVRGENSEESEPHGRYRHEIRPEGCGEVKRSEVEKT
jgi:hypothetical protein